MRRPDPALPRKSAAGLLALLTALAIVSLVAAPAFSLRHLGLAETAPAPDEAGAIHVLEGLRVPSLEPLLPSGRI
ncbi:MAG TPA: hypothetical protein VGD66_02130 [Allosphingosinicella sp.]|jgi:hypothetical protein